MHTTEYYVDNATLYFNDGGSVLTNRSPNQSYATMLDKKKSKKELKRFAEDNRREMILRHRHTPYPKQIKQIKQQT